MGPNLAGSRQAQRASVIAVLLALAACEYGGVTIVDPPAPVPRTLALTIVPDTEGR